MDVRLFLLFGLIHFAHGEAWDLSCEQIKLLVDGHNSRRLKVASGEVLNQPAAAQMGSLIWDEELAAHAKNWASNYVNEIGNAASESFSLRFDSVWTNTDRLPMPADIPFDLNQRLASWFEGSEHYTYGPWSKNEPYQFYTQMVWADSVFLGCGVAEKYQDDMNFKTYYLVCHYGPGGNVEGEFPYKALPDNSPRKAELECPIFDCSQPYGRKCM